VRRCSNSTFQKATQLIGVMVLLLDLPDMLIVSVWQKWINVAVLAWLDSATCSNHARRNFLCLVSEDNFFIDQHCGLKTESYELADLYTSWILRGQIGIAELIVTDSFANELIRRPYLKLHGYRICNIIVEDVPDIQCTRGEMLGDLRRYCPSVKVLCCRSPVPPTVQINIAVGWKQLTHLTLEGRDINEELVAGVETVKRWSNCRYWRLRWLPISRHFYANVPYCCRFLRSMWRYG
jgi:hypothetical protein